MSGDTIGWGGRTGAALRVVAGVVLGGFFAAVAWAVIFAYAFEHQWTDTNDLRTIGLLRNHEPLDGAKRGFAVICGVALLVAVLLAIVQHWLPKRLTTAALSVALAIFLGWGLLFGPLTADRAYSIVDGQRFPAPSGLLGLDGGRATPMVGLIASVVAGFLLIRCQRVVADASWWRPSRTVGSRSTAFSSLELPEEGTEEGDVGTAGEADSLRRA